MVMKRPPRHVGLPPPCYHPDSTSVTLSIYYGGHLVHLPEAKYVGGAEGVEDNEGGAGDEGVEGNEGGAGDELVDSDYEMGEGNNNEKMTTENEVRTGGENVGDESGSTSEDEEIDVVDNEGDLDEHRDSDGNDGDGGTVAVFNPEDTYDPTFDLGMRFSNKSEFKKALLSHAIKSKRTLKFIKNDKIKVYAKCGNEDSLKEIEGSPDYQYTRLWDYAEEVRATNPGSTVILGTEEADDGEHRFSRIQHEFTFMSDKQKGLMQAFEEVFPAKACTVIEFKKSMQEMKGISQAAVDWFNDKPPTQWSRSHFSELPICDMLLNNVCETFNACILNAREKSILTMLEWIREYLMRRMQENRDRAIGKWNGKICPKIQKILQKQIAKASDCILIKVDDIHYQVSCFDGSQHSVDLRARSCSCRKFQLSGIPCKHACCAIFYQKQDPVDYVDKCYSVETFKSVYQPSILPMTHESLWVESFIIPPLSPNFGRGPGRPSKARRREAEEPRNKKKKKKRGLQKLKRIQKTVHCTSCGEPGHNSARYPEREPTEDTAGNQHNRKVQVFTLKNHYGFLINLNLSKQQTKRKAETGPQEPGACSSDPTQGDTVFGSNANHGVENSTIQPPESGSNAIHGPKNPTILPPEAGSNAIHGPKNSTILPPEAGSNANHPTILPPVHEDIHEEDAFEDAVITQEWHDVTHDNPIYRPRPSMYDQLTISNQQGSLQPQVQIRVPPPMIGSQGVPRFIPPTRSTQVEDAIINEGGYKYLDLDKLSRN
ncbi:UNVERIFIED_CONTAM: hypothetical protein Slati_0770600 [Sesamum latifolium]|uniref:SWIM-type domain-containing protein n=1 Tax=Sesamum latifolium TaxID=2727402 RepID=A0AAW2XK82_9LAMI